MKHIFQNNEQCCFLPTQLSLYSTFITVETPYTNHISVPKVAASKYSYFDSSYIKYIIKSICQSLLFLESLNMMHGLISPSNIFINDSDGKILISDYCQYTINKNNHSIDYFSIEQIKGKEIDIKSDIWSCGCILYYYLTKTNPFIDKKQQLGCKYKELENNDFSNLILSKTINSNPRNRLTPFELYNLIIINENKIEINNKIYPLLLYNQYQIETDEELEIISKNMNLILLLIKEYNKCPELNFIFLFIQMSQISYQYSILFKNNITEYLNFFDTFRQDNKLDLSWKQYSESFLKQLSSHFISLRNLKQLIFVSII